MPNAIKIESQKNNTTRQKVTSKPARSKGKITYYGVTHLATRQENASLETNGIHITTKINNIGSAKIKLYQIQQPHAIISSTTAPASTDTRNLSPLSIKFIKH
jgi:hypothetical protein